MIRIFRRSISRKLRAVVLATTFLALLMSAAALMVFEIQNYRRAWVTDLTTQADILARVSAPALQFNDPEAAFDNLRVLKSRPQVLEAALYTPSGRLFATYKADLASLAKIPASAGRPGYRLDGEDITLYHQVVENGEVLGTIYLHARYEVAARARSYLVIVAGAMLASLLVAALLSGWLQRAITRPILDVTDVAREVVERRNFSLRVQKTTDDEIGVLVNAFNGMLNEVESRTKALEESNRSLKQEMRDRLEAEDALRTADRRKDEFLATLAHELRNPLAPLMTGLEMMRLTGADSPASTRARAAMERQLNQMVRLVDDLIDVSRISRGRLVIRKERVELQGVVRNAVETVGKLIEARKHTLELHLPSQSVFLEADPTRLAQVFSNLLNNAAKYTDEGGHIVFSVLLEDKQARITVSDNGIGIAPELLETVFDMFTQADYSLERSQAGLGVGLTLARRLVELHGGSIEAQSAGDGQGSTFTVRLPLAPTREGSRPDHHPSTQMQAPRRHRILLADDNIDFVDNIAALLKSMGHDVCVTHDGQEALQAAAGFHPQFAFLDIGLPKLNGYDLARQLREQPENKHLVLVAVTGWGQEKDRELARQAGFDHHLVKPASIAKIVAFLDGGAKSETTSEDFSR